MNLKSGRKYEVYCAWMESKVYQKTKGKGREGMKEYELDKGN